jgi:hypothetical protein
LLSSVIIISSVRVYLVVEGQWRPDSSWNYNPMLAIENAEIGGTLIALSIPGLKPLFDRFFSKVGGLHRSHTPSFNVLSPSAVFASSDASKSVVVEDRAMHSISNPWAGLGMAQFVPHQATAEGTSTDDDDDKSAGHGTVPPNPWRESLGGMGYGAQRKS